MKKYLITIFILSLLSTPAAADWSPDGVAMRTIEHGRVNGGIYIGGGHGREYTTTYTQNFTVPDGTVKWARLWVSAKDTIWINVTLNGHQLGNYTDPRSDPKVYGCYLEDRSMYWAYYDNAAKCIVNGTNTATADLGTRVGLNTKSWGMALLVVYEGGDSPEPLEYWVNEGNPLLHGNHPPFAAHRNTTDTSFENVTDPDTVTDAVLWTIYIWGSEENEQEQPDALRFNLDRIAVDASDGAGGDEHGRRWRGACFDMEKWDVIHSLARDNIVAFDRGDDSILCPVGAVLVLKRGSETQVADRTEHSGLQIQPAVSLEITPDAPDFRVPAPGRQSEIHVLTLSNTGTSGITVTAWVSDTAADPYVDELLLDSDNWQAYSGSIAKGRAVAVSAVVNVPQDCTGVEIQGGKLIFWAEIGEIL
jgi:hypothetical protein